MIYCKNSVAPCSAPHCLSANSLPCQHYVIQDTSLEMESLYIAIYIQHQVQHRLEHKVKGCFQTGYLSMYRSTLDTKVHLIFSVNKKVLCTSTIPDSSWEASPGFGLCGTLVLKQSVPRSCTVPIFQDPSRDHPNPRIRQINTTTQPDPLKYDLQSDL